MDVSTSDFRYEIDDNDGFTVRCWHVGQEEPWMLQPHWPSGDAWGSRSDAQTWIEDHIESLVDSAAPYAAGGPGQERRAKPTPLEAALNKLGATGLTIEDLKLLLNL